MSASALVLQWHDRFDKLSLQWHQAHSHSVSVLQNIQNLVEQRQMTLSYLPELNDPHRNAAHPIFGADTPLILSQIPDLVQRLGLKQTAAIERSVKTLQADLEEIGQVVREMNRLKQGALDRIRSSTPLLGPEDSAAGPLQISLVEMADWIQTMASSYDRESFALKQSVGPSGLDILSNDEQSDALARTLGRWNALSLLDLDFEAIVRERVKALRRYERQANQG
ncbi:uncharacterized protein BJ171DRAFT_507395 [Polychytrium aggregatum]|uniref:uncharacterized protein n=1 Tax=Polychytrium aggregatum TaxID=110093 RepID=UPI0022FE503A|nr:uncharacterized protein BJ171DRAFT_507395 [Polychytrium aggregatum]KAI9204017.1 hypothetical protein BJ171DRAFT_507395 [Polychytrium aggregatum]